MAAVDRESRGQPQADATSSAQNAADTRRAQRVLIGLAAAYALTLVVLYALGLFGFVWKTLVVPSLLIVAYAARRFQSFVRDWAVFLAAVVLFDSLRGLVYGLLVRFSWRVYMGYALALEQLLFGTPPPSARLQAALFQPGQVGALEKLLVSLHASHFLVFLFFALWLWLVRPAAFARFKPAMLLVMYGGIACYVALPTVPPWMAAGRFYVTEPIAHIPALVYNLSMPALAESFDVNPVAAMPSLHAAFPILLTLTCFREFGRWGFAMLAYTLAVLFAIVCLGEHYLVDVLAGALLAGVAYVAAFRLPWFARAGELATPAPGEKAMSRLLRPLVIAGVLLAGSEAAGLGAVALQGRDVPTEAFVREELDGRSPMASYYHGLNAYYAGAFARAQGYFAKAVHEVPDVAKQSRAYLLLGESAYRARDFRGAAETLGSQPKLSKEQALMLAEARLELGQRELGFQVLDFVAGAYPADDALRREKRRLEQRYGRATR